MKLLLTSGGVSNDALVSLLGKPISEAAALCIPTAEYGHPGCTSASAWRFVAGRSGVPMCDLGWKSVGLLELTALPSVGKERWVPWVREADALLSPNLPQRSHPDRARSRPPSACHPPVDFLQRLTGPAQGVNKLKPMSTWLGIAALAQESHGCWKPRVGADFAFPDYRHAPTGGTQTS